MKLNKASTSDGSTCLPCGTNTTGLVTSTGDCGCSNRYVLIEKDVLGNFLPAKICQACPTGSMVITTSGRIAGKVYTASRYLCQSCPDPLMTMSFVNNVYSCRCPTGYTIVGVNGIGPQSCVSTTLATPYIQELSSAIVVSYTSNDDDTITRQVSSLTMQHYFVYAATNCQYYWTVDSFRYCQLLANLCVLALYSLSHPTCQAYIDLARPAIRTLVSPYNITGWVTGMPWIYYDRNYDGLTVCEQNIYQNLVSLRQDQLKYIIASYYLNGTFYKFTPLDTFFTYCKRSTPYTNKGGGDSTSTTWQYYGYNVEINYECELRSLLNSVSSTIDTQLFHELFIYDPVTNQYAPIPVRLIHLIQMPMDYYSQFDHFCDDHDHVVRRFYLFDVVSGRETVDGDPTVIRYASKILFHVRRMKATQSGIYPPALTIQYATVAPSDWTEIDNDNYNGKTDSVVDYYFQVIYTIDLSLFQSTLFIFMILIFILCMFYFFLRYYNWNKRNSRVITQAQLTSDLGAINFENMINILLLLMNTYVIVFFPITVLVTWYFFVFYKLQSVPSILLPPMIQISALHSPYLIFVVQLHLLAIFQICYVLYQLVYKQGNFHLYLIDWEPAKHKHTHSTSAAATKKIAGQKMANGEAAGEAEEGGKGGGGGGDSYQISIWRTVLVANKLLDIQITRKSNIIFTLFWIGFFMIGLNLDNNGTNQPSLNDLNNPNNEYPMNIVLRFSNTTFFWLILSLFQYLWNYFIYEHYFTESIESKFIDFCTILKISLFVLDEKYHGYYLHCHSSIQYADINMLEVINMLSHEENGLLMDRALENAPIDIQSFELFLSGEWFEEYMKLYHQLLQIQSINDILDYRRQQDSQIQQRQQQQANRRGGGNDQANSIWNINSRYNRLNTGSLNSSKHQKGIKLGNFYYSHVPNDKLYSTWNTLISFLKEFIDNNYSKSYLRYNIKERNYYEYMTNDSPDLSTPNQPSIFITDTKQTNYTKCFFYGNELDLLLFNILTYSIYDMWFNNTMTSILLCYLSNWGITYWRYYLGKVRNK